MVSSKLVVFSMLATAFACAVLLEAAPTAEKGKDSWLVRKFHEKVAPETIEWLGDKYDAVNKGLIRFLNNQEKNGLLQLNWGAEGKPQWLIDEEAAEQKQQQQQVPKKPAAAKEESDSVENVA